jgi:hypothetical protein
MGSSPEPAVPAYRRVRMPRKHLQVLGVDLNCSESGRQVLFTLLRASFRKCRHRASGRTAARPRSWGPPVRRPERWQASTAESSPAPENFFSKTSTCLTTKSRRGFDLKRPVPNSPANPSSCSKFAKRASQHPSVYILKRTGEAIDTSSIGFRPIQKIATIHASSGSFGESRLKRVPVYRV